LKGYRIKVIDGNRLTGTEHRLGVLRDETGAALPGLAVVVLLPEHGLIEDVIVSEDAYIQETRLLEPIVRRMERRDLIIADRLYCTSDFLFEVEARQASFVIRQHLGHLRWEQKGKRKRLGATETGQLYEQQVELVHPQTEAVLRLRRITVKLDQPARDGNEELHILTNLPLKEASAEQVAALYRKRWTIETAFQEMTTALHCELKTLGHPSAALFSFCMAAACFNVLSVIVSALRQAHDDDIDEDVSLYALADELSGTYRGMMIALPAATWTHFQSVTTKELANQLIRWAKQVPISRYKKYPRASKRRTNRTRAPTKHVATSRLLDAQKRRLEKEK
jgi:hypothetical protein